MTRVALGRSYRIHPPAGATTAAPFFPSPLYNFKLYTFNFFFMENQPPIYHACIKLARAVYDVTLHFPKALGRNEGMDLRRAAAGIVRDCLLANRAQRGSKERADMQARMADGLAMIEALTAIITEQKYCVRTQQGNRWKEIIDNKQEARINEAVSIVGKQLYGWRQQRGTA